MTITYVPAIISSIDLFSIYLLIFFKKLPKYGVGIYNQ